MDLRPELESPRCVECRERASQTTNPSDAGFETVPIELSVVVPTYQEAQNVPILVDRIALALQGLAWEIIVVDDDSPDDTSSIARAIARADRRVRIITRIGRRGLASACVEGMLASPAPYVAVMDADLQHDENLLRPMFDLLREDRADCVVGSRYRDSVQIAAFGAGRARASRIATAIAQRFTRANLTDPMSGFFMIKYDLVLPLIPSLSAVGFKIFLDIVLTAPASMRVAELPYDFRAREAGESKFDLKAAYDFIYLIVDKTLGRFMPARFIIFAVIGSIGVFVHLAALWLIFVVRQNNFAISQLIATVVAMTTNFLLNNELTFRDRRLRGRALLRGWVSFAAACSVGAVANVGVAAQLYAGNRAWWLAALAGIAIGAVWNYAVTSFYTWGKG